MLFKNDAFELDGERMRLLHADAAANVTWCISVDSKHAWPVEISYSRIVNLEALPQSAAAHRTHSEACKKKCDEAWTRIETMLQQHGTDLYDPQVRNYCIKEFATKRGYSASTLRTDLRRYWQRGQNKYALMPDYDKSGRRAARAKDEPLEITSGRGRRPKAGHNVFQMTSVDADHMKDVIEASYLKDSRITTVDAYTELVNRHYQYLDGNQQPYANPPGGRPSLRQFRRYLKKHYNIEIRIRRREGDSDFEREHRAVLGTLLADCLGVGHVYEIDATIADIYLVSQEDPNKIIGKPTLYLIIDRKSRLIVGFYFGLENASWSAALQAILSISEDKRKLCERYGVKYDPKDWPAHQVFPQEFVGDRGEMISNPSTNIAEGLHVIVTNLPGKRPDWKALVECGFRLLHAAVRPIAPAYDPPSNATRRRGKHYEKDACLNVKDFGNLILNAIIQSNRREILDYPLSPEELMAGVRPSPIELWNHGIVSRAGVLTRYAEEHVRFALLRKDTAVVTERGVEFRGCFYSFQEAIAQKWFEAARKRRFRVKVSFDPRLVDQIYVHSQDGKGAPHLATLTARSQNYQGLSFEEVHYYEWLRGQIRQDSEHERLQNSIDLRNKTEPVVAAAKKRLKEVGPQARSARKADTKAARNQERASERQEMALLEHKPAQSITTQVSSDSLPSVKPAGDHRALLAAIRERMRA